MTQALKKIAEDAGISGVRKLLQRVDGDIHGDVLVQLTESADVSGDIFCPRVCMDEGARFNGTLHMRQ